ncbi:hypothetical protein V8G54_020142 [Vigna mungo]|uniref:Uncharacterized protein n=1 Tax=Vigna mungo TaxID=3915 RepID=A0AAQ3RWF0_VIGMU
MVAFALFCCVQRRKKKMQRKKVIHFDEQKRVQETIVSGPFGQNTVVVTVEDNVHIDEEITKSEKVGHSVHGVHAKSSSPLGVYETNSINIVGKRRIYVYIILVAAKNISLNQYIS